MTGMQCDALHVLRQHEGVAGQEMALQPIRKSSHRGFDSWLIWTDAGQILLKLARRGKSVDHKFNNLIAALHLVARWQIPAPRLIGFGQQDGLFAARRYILLHYIDGQDAEDALPHLTDDERSSFFFDLGRAMAQLHRIPVHGFSDLIGDETRRQTYGEMINHKLDSLTRWCFETQGIARETAIPLIEKLRARFSALPVAPQPAMVHGDLTLRNLLVCSDRSCRLLDFERSQFYDPYSDFARLKANVFDPCREDEARFLSGYATVIPLPGDHRLRWHDYVGLELLMGYVYRTFMQDDGLAAGYWARLAKWRETFA